MKQKRGKAALIAGCLAAAALVGLLARRDPEPYYQGRSLSEWHALWSKSVEFDDPQSKAQTQVAANAIRAIGTNAIPILLKRLRQLPSDLRVQIHMGVVEHLPESLAENALIHHQPYDDGRVEPTSTFVLLGPIASPAVPELAKLLRATKRNHQITRAAAYCLAAIGKDGLPPLLDALSRPELPCCYMVAEILSVVPQDGHKFNFGTNIDQAVPLLAANALSKDPDLAKSSIEALGRLKRQPEIAIPALVKSLNSPDFLCRNRAVRALALFGPAAVPALLDALNHADVNVRMSATNNLRFLAKMGLAPMP